MKINEIIQEGPLDAVKGLYTDYKVSQLGTASVKLWKKHLNSLEAKNNYEPLTAQQLQDQFTVWADNTLLGRFALSSTSSDFQQMLRAYAQKVSRTPRDNNLLKSAFTTIIDGARKMMPATGQPARDNKPSGEEGTNMCQEPPKHNAATGAITICGQPVNKKDLPPAFLKKLGI